MVVVVMGRDVGVDVGMGVGVVVGIGMVVAVVGVVASWWAWLCRRCHHCIMVVGVGRGCGWGHKWWWWLRLRLVDRWCGWDMVRFARDQSTIYISIMNWDSCGGLAQVVEASD